MSETEILKLIAPEIVIVAAMLNIMGIIIKKANVVTDNFIPLLLGLIGILFSILVICPKEGFAIDSIVKAVIQGVLAAGTAVYVHQLKIQIGNPDKH